MFVQELTKEAYNYTMQSKRKTLQPRDLGMFMSLQCCIPSLYCCTFIIVWLLSFESWNGECGSFLRNKLMHHERGYCIFEISSLFIHNKYPLMSMDPHVDASRPHTELNAECDYYQAVIIIDCWWHMPHAMFSLGVISNSWRMWLVYRA